MATHYEALAAPRFRIEIADGVEQVVIPAPRSIFVMLFLTVWLCGWSVGGIAAVNALLVKPFSPFLAIWLCGWALGESIALFTLGWMLAGQEKIRNVGSDLEMTTSIVGIGRTKLFRGNDIRNLRAGTGLYGRGGQRPCVKFDYGAKTIEFAAGCSDAECQMIIDRLGRYVPKSAVSGGRPL